MTKTINIMNAKILISMCFMLFLNIALANTSARKQIRLQRRDIPINRELVMDPEAWYDTEEHIIDVTMHSAGVLTVYYADGETVHSVNNLTFDFNRVFCDKDCNLIILETADGIIYEGYLKEEIK